MVASHGYYIPAALAARKILKKRREEEAPEMKKRPRIGDRLSNLPDDLKVRILSFLDTKKAAKTSVLSKAWVSLWTRVPVLEFNDVFNTNNPYVFYKFVDRLLSLRDESHMLDRLIFDRRGTSSDQILEKLFNYAFSHGVKQLEANIGYHRDDTWPLPVICRNSTCLDSLTSLKLQSEYTISCPFLGPKFKNLTVLYLKGAIVTDEEPFSGFPVLEKLTLLNCDIGKTLRVNACNLSNLSISNRYKSSLNCCELTTPRLRFFGYRGNDFPLIRTEREGLPVLDTIAIDFNGIGIHNHVEEKKTFDDLLSLFCALSNAITLQLYFSIIEVLRIFQDELVKRRSPFGKLKCLKMDFRKFEGQNLRLRKESERDESFEIPWDVEDYFILNSPNAELTTIYPYYWEFGIVEFDGDYFIIEDDLVSSDLF